MTLPPQIRFCFAMVADSFSVCLLLCFRSSVPLEPPSLDRAGWRLVARLGTQQFPDQAAELARDRHDRFVAVERPPQEPGVTPMQAVLGFPTQGAHLPALTFLAPA